MVTGLDIRLNRIMREDKMLCVPMDHGISSGPIEGLEDPSQAIYACEQSLTSVIINKGILRALPRVADLGILVHFSASTSLSSTPNRKMLTGTVQEAVRMGADGVSLHINVGSRWEPEMVQDLGMVAEQCQMWSMPLLAMMYPRGENVENPHDPDIVAHAARIGAECGADIVKTVYTGDVDSFAEVVRGAGVPVVVAGGPQADTAMDILQMTQEVIEAGASGVTFGRNIFAHPNPKAMVEALHSIIFEKKTAEEVGGDV